MQNKVRNVNTGEITDAGEPLIEERTINGELDRQYNIQYGAWVDVGSRYDCVSWSPDRESITWGEAFTQYGTGCKQDQERSRVDSYLSESGTPVSLSRQYSFTLENLTDSRSATGLKDAWVPHDPVVGEWETINALYDCSSWTPTPASKTANETFVQNALCSSDQERSYQAQERQLSTGDVRQAGAAETQRKTLTGQTAVRNYSVSFSAWAVSKAAYGCTNWTPSPTSQPIGKTFEQQATDCKIEQTRSRSGTYQDHVTQASVAETPVAETRVLSNQTSTRQAVGTLEQWVATTPAYSTWTNTNTLYECGIWSPSPAGVTTTSTFSQTADCKTNQTRTRQDREQEATTLAYRNAGLPVTEARTLTNQTATRNYTVTLGTWQNSGSLTGCTNWSPATSEYNAGITFTQTATNCSQAQSRSRNESYVDHKTNQTVSVSSTTETRTLTNQTSTRSATGTKVTQVCKKDSAHNWGLVMLPGPVPGVPGARMFELKWAGTVLYFSPSPLIANQPIVLGGNTYTPKSDSSVCRL